jgi:hypothetical protein
MEVYKYRIKRSNPSVYFTVPCTGGTNLGLAKSLLRYPSTLKIMMLEIQYLTNLIFGTIQIVNTLSQHLILMY